MAVAVEADPFDAMFDSLTKATQAGDKSVNNPDVPNPPAPDPGAPNPSAAAVEEPVVVAAPVVGENLAPEVGTEIEGAPLTEAEVVAAQQKAKEDEATAKAEAEAAAAEAAKKPQAPPQSDAALHRIADLLADRRAAPIVDPQPQAPQAPFSAEDQAFLQQYHADFGDVARAERLMRRHEYNLLTTHIFNEVAKTFGPRMALLEQLADSAAYNALTQQVPDYDTQRDKVVEWVKTQPGYLQQAYNNVIANGSVAEISDLFNRFSTATGAPAPAQAAAGTTQAAPKTPVVELSSAAKAAAARLAPVNTKRSAPAQTGAPTNFDDAFDQFAKVKIA